MHILTSMCLCFIYIFTFVVEIYDVLKDNVLSKRELFLYFYVGSMMVMNKEMEKREKFNWHYKA